MKLSNELGLKFAFLLGIAVFLASCAVRDELGEAAYAPTPPQTSAARMGLPAVLRPFHDELEQHGDWVLVEPQGWVFRPRVNTVAWRPYQDGHWQPSWTFGWVWESNEPFGWITDHYGFWFHDEFQGWLWQPYGAWAPSWVAWVEVGEYVGWAPLPPSGVPNYDRVPGGLFTYVSASALASASPSTRASFVSDIPDDKRGVRPISRIASHHGVYWNAGPDPDEILGPGDADRLRIQERDGRAGLTAPPRSLVESSPDVDLRLLEARTTRAWSEAKRELDAMRARRAGAGRDGVPPPATAPPTRAPATSPRIKPSPDSSDSLATETAADSLKRKRAWRPGAPRPPRRDPR